MLLTQQKTDDMVIRRSSRVFDWIHGGSAEFAAHAALSQAPQKKRALERKFSVRGQRRFLPLLDKDFSMTAHKGCESCSGDLGEPHTFENVCWTLQYNNFNLTLPHDETLNPPEQEKIGNKIKIDHQKVNACIQFYDAENTALTPWYSAKFYKTEKGGSVYVDWRNLRPRREDLRIDPLLLFQKRNRSGVSINVPPFTKDELLKLSKNTTYDAATKKYKYSGDDTIAQQLLKIPQKKKKDTWDKGIFLVIYEAIFPGEESGKTQGKCLGYAPPKESKVVESRFENTFCVYFTLEIFQMTDAEKLFFCIKCTLLDEERQERLRTEPKANEAADEDKEAVDEDGKKKPRKGKDGDEKKPKEKKREKGTPSDDEIIESLFKKLRTSAQGVDGADGNLKDKGNFASLGWKYEPKLPVDVDIKDENPGPIWDAIKRKTQELVNEKYAADLKNVLGGKEIYELEPEAAAYKYALDALLSLWLYTKTKDTLPVAPPPSLTEQQPHRESPSTKKQKLKAKPPKNAAEKKAAKETAEAAKAAKETEKAAKAAKETEKAEAKAAKAEAKAAKAAKAEAKAAKAAKEAKDAKAAKEEKEANPKRKQRKKRTQNESS